MTARFFEQQSFNVFNTNNKFTLNEENSHKIISVLRLSVGSIINLFNNTGVEFTAKIIGLRDHNNKKQNKLIEVEIVASALKKLESPIKIHLIQAIAKHDNMDFIVQKAVELGVHQITPIITERTIVKLPRNQAHQKIEHWQKIANNACCQCGRNIIPRINAVVLFSDFITIEQDNGINKFILSPYNTPLNKVISLQLNQEIMLLIGPEGGFSNNEMEMAIKNNYRTITIGPRILRSETAPIVAISIFQYKYGDLNTMLF